MPIRIPNQEAHVTCNPHVLKYGDEIKYVSWVYGGVLGILLPILMLNFCSCLLVIW